MISVSLIQSTVKVLCFEYISLIQSTVKVLCFEYIF